MTLLLSEQFWPEMSHSQQYLIQGCVYQEEKHYPITVWWEINVFEDREEEEEGRALEFVPEGRPSIQVHSQMVYIWSLDLEFSWISTGVCPRIEVLTLKDTRREEASGQCEIADGFVFQFCLLAFIDTCLNVGKLLKSTGSW